jgi:hypothetical protein
MSSTEGTTSQTHRDLHEEIASSDTHQHSLTPSATTGHLLPRNGTSDNNVLFVDWDGPDDPENPRKYTALSAFVSPFLHVHSWSPGRKWRITFIVSAFTFISPLASSVIAPASEQLAERFDIRNAVLLAMTTSAFVLAYGVYPSSFHTPFCLLYAPLILMSLWSVISWPAQRDIWPFPRDADFEPVVSWYALCMPSGQRYSPSYLSTLQCGTQRVALRAARMSSSHFVSSLGSVVQPHLPSVELSLAISSNPNVEERPCLFSLSLHSSALS